MSHADKSNGYEEIASIFIQARDNSGIGISLVSDWSGMLPPGAAVLDVACGSGVPIAEVLLKNGISLYAMDASPSMIKTFQTRFPSVPVECAAVEESTFFERTFDGVIACGLVFLLDAEAQRRLIAKVSTVLRPRGSFLFTAPSQSCTWRDVMTGQTSISLGREEYRTLLEAAGMTLREERRDEGDNHYYFVEKL